MADVFHFERAISRFRTEHGRTLQSEDRRFVNEGCFGERAGPLVQGLRRWCCAFVLDDRGDQPLGSPVSEISR